MGLQSIIIGVLALVGGIFAYHLTGTWVGGTLVALSLGFVCLRLMAGEILQASMLLLVAAVGLFYFMVSGGPVVPPSNLAQSAESLKAPAIEFVAGAPAGGASGGTAPGKEAAAPASALANTNTAGASANFSAKVLRDCSECPEMVVVPPGSFSMGSVANADSPDESPPHTVTLQSFAMGQDAVTRGQFAAYAKSTSRLTDAERLGGCMAQAGDGWTFKKELNWRHAGIFQTDNHPVVCVSWNDAMAYIDWLNATTHQRYRLPTEAEREYATRAGTADAYWWGQSASMEQANFHGEGEAQGASTVEWRHGTVATRQFLPNPFGLYNVHGNVWEWVDDCQHDNYQGAPVDGTEWISNCASTRRGARGGGWSSPAYGIRTTQRSWYAPDLPSYAGGFRVVRDLESH